MNMLILAGALAGAWMLQLALMKRQASAFLAKVAELRDQGWVLTGFERHRGLRTYVALAVKDGEIQAASVLKGASVFARPSPLESVVGHSVAAAAGSAIPGMDRRTAAAAAHAASFGDQLSNLGTRSSTSN